MQEDPIMVHIKYIRGEIKELKESIDDMMNNHITALAKDVTDLKGNAREAKGRLGGVKLGIIIALTAGSASGGLATGLAQLLGG